MQLQSVKTSILKKQKKVVVTKYRTAFRASYLLFIVSNLLECMVYQKLFLKIIQTNEMKLK